MAKLLLIAFHAHEVAGGAAFAQALGTPFDLLVLSGEPQTNLGASRVLSASLPEIPPADGLAAALRLLCEGYSHVAAVATMESKDVLARLAGLLDASMVTDVIGLESTTVFRRPMVAGSVIATVETSGEPIVLTTRPSNFPPAALSGTSPVETISLNVVGRTRRVGKGERAATRPDLTQAKTIVSGGRPLRDAETFERVLGGLADAFGGAVGATRAAVDAGIAPNELQVGQTGKIVAPDLYIAAGVSGSTQHMAGIKDSKVIVAINKDPDAPIFEVADYGLVADLFEALPELQQIVSKD